MTDFLIERIKAVEILAAIDTLETKQAATQAAVEALSKQAGSTPVDAQVFDDAQTAYTSAEIDSSGCRKFLLRIILAVALTPISIQVKVQFSQDGTTYEDYVHGPFSGLLYASLPATIAECIDGECLGAKMKISVVAIGTDATKTFTLTCKLILTR